MKSMILILIALSMTTAHAFPNEDVFLSTSLPSVLSHMSTTGDQVRKDVLALAQEDAIKFIASKGQSGMTEALQTAIDEVNEKLLKAGIEKRNDADATALIVFVNAINASK